MPELYISIDVEADGPYPGSPPLGPGYSMVELGACTLDGRHVFSEFLHPVTKEWDEGALEAIGRTRQQTLDDGRPPTIVMSQFSRWLKALADEYSVSLVPITFSTWDWVWVWTYLQRYTSPVVFSHSSLDIKSYAMGKLRYDGFKKTGKRNLVKAVGELPPHTHRALDDALEQAELFKRLKELP